MDMSFYTAAVGAAQQQQRLNVTGNNIANVNTYGYKAEKPSFSSLMYGNLNGINNAQLPRGSGSVMSMANTDFSGGAPIDTGRKQDYAILGEGFFGLYNPTTGEVSYTRDGSFTLSEFRRPKTEEEIAIEEAAGELGDGEEIDPLKTVFMLSDGMGRFVLNGQGAMTEVTDGEKEQPVGVFDFTSTNGMIHMGDNRYIPAEKNGAVRFGTGKATRGMLEGSNADLAEQMGKVIEAQRSYSYALKMVQTSDEIENTVNALRG